jgi:nucleoside 2-deoxyribosyltransferase
MRIYVAGPVTHAKDTYAQIVEMVERLRKDGFSVDSPLEKAISHEIDYRDNIEAARSHFASLERYISNDVDVVVAILTGPSDGRTTEQILAIKYKKLVIGFAPGPLHSPWTVVHTDKIVRTVDDLIEVLKKYEKETNK